MRPYNFATNGCSLTKLFQTTYFEGGVITGVPFLEGQPPKIWEGQKTSKFRRDFWELSTLIANISRTDLHIEHLKKNLFNRNPFHVGGRKFGEFWSTNKKVLEVHTGPPKWTFFGRLHFGHLGVLPPQIFIHARDWSRLLSAHPNWDRGPPPKKKIIVKIKNRA